MVQEPAISFIGFSAPSASLQGNDALLFASLRLCENPAFDVVCGLFLHGCSAKTAFIRTEVNIS
jgi:hypothetical protein